MAEREDPERSPEKPVEEWTTGDEPMTGPQRSYLETLSRQAEEAGEVPGELTKAEASRRIDELASASGGMPRQATTIRSAG